MKIKQSTPPDAKSARKVAGPKLQLPEPMELAKLAAILRPESQPDAAMQTAMQFYVEAVLFLGEQPSSFESLLERYGSGKRKRALLVKEAKAIWKDTLELDTNADDDEARRFLSECGVKLKKAGAVIGKIRDYCLEPETLLAQTKRERGGRTFYAIPRHILRLVADRAKRKRKDDKLKSWHASPAGKKAVK